MSYCLSFNTSEEGADRVRGRGDEGRKGVRGWEEREEGGGEGRRGREREKLEGKRGKFCSARRSARGGGRQGAGSQPLKEREKGGGGSYQCQSSM